MPLITSLLVERYLISRAVSGKPSCPHCLALVGTEPADKPFAHFSPNMV